MGKRNKRQQPSDPRNVAAALERAEAKREVARLQAIGAQGWLSHEKQKDGHMKWVARGQRLDVFSLLLRDDPRSDRSGERGAVQWLETLIRTASGENGAERRPDYIRGSSEGAPGQNVTQAMIDADLYLIAATEALPPHIARMMFDLLKPDEALLTRWREVVQRCTGETNPQAQGAAVRAACGQLLWVQNNIDRLVRERQDRRVAA